MSPEQIVQQASTKLESAYAHFEDELKKIRAGRAHPSMLDGVMAEAYGQQMPLIQLATITAPEANLLQVSPFDPNNLQAISQAIRDNQTLGMNPMDDGHVVRIPIPPLTEERRREIAKQLGQKLEECMINFRNCRHDAIKSLDQLKKDKTIGEDEHKRFVKQIDDAMTKNKSQAEELAKAKEKEVMTL